MYLLDTELIKVDDLSQKLVPLSDRVTRLTPKGLNGARRALVGIHRSGRGARERDFECRASLFE